MALWKFFTRKIHYSRFLLRRPLLETLEDRTVLSFITAASYGVGMSPQFVAAADFNGDGIPDLAVANSTDGTVSIMLGQGGASYQTKQNYAVGMGPQSLTVKDFNSDGILDLAVANALSGTVS